MKDFKKFKTLIYKNIQPVSQNGKTQYVLSDYFDAGTLTIKKENASITSMGLDFSIELQNDSFDVLKLDDKKHFFDFKNNDVNKLIEENNVFNFCGNDILRPVMNNIYFTERIVATNAHYLCAVKHGYSIEHPFFIPAKLKQVFKYIESVEYDEYGIHILKGIIDGISFEIQYRQDGKFPDWQAVMPNLAEYSSSVKISKADIEEKHTKYKEGIEESETIHADTNKKGSASGEFIIMPKLKEEGSKEINVSSGLLKKLGFSEYEIFKNDQSDSKAYYFNPSKKKAKAVRKQSSNNQEIEELKKQIELLKQENQNLKDLVQEKENQKPKAQKLDVEIIEYSDKSIALFGDGTIKIKDSLKNDCKGIFNPFLKYKGSKKAGWIVSKKYKDKCASLVNG